MRTLTPYISKDNNDMRGYNMNAIYTENDNLNSTAHYFIIEDFKDATPYELLMCEDLNTLTEEYNTKKEQNTDRPYKIELAFDNGEGQKYLVKVFEN
jgi:hypothetical protein